MDDYICYNKQTSRFTDAKTNIDKFVVLIGVNANVMVSQDCSDDLLNDDLVIKRVNFTLGDFDVCGAIRNPQFIEHLTAKYTFIRRRDA